MSFLSPMKCLLGRCRPTRRSYRWDPTSQAHVGECRNCGKPIVRKGHRNWKRIRLEPDPDQA
ncbi:MAG: hypothetical protein V2J14_10525 [Erythrobacter sp.]|jgi:hypothetical protein|nr:hypothetical protein [Erythrobacter sp.]